MSEQPTYLYRLTTINGIIADFQSPNQLESMWTILKGDGHFQLMDAEGRVIERIAFHAIASLKYLNQQSAMIYATPGGQA